MKTLVSKIEGHELALSAHIMSAFNLEHDESNFDVKSFGSVSVTEIKTGEHKGFYDNFYEDGKTYFMPA